MSLNPRLTDWRDQVVWLVGASRGIGRATASALHARGARVFVSARQAPALDEFTAQHPGAVALPLDVTDAAAVRQAARTLLDLGRLDAVMYCAGHARALRASGFSLDEMLRHQQVNYVGALHVLDAALPHFLAQRAGHLCLLGGAAGYGGLPQGLADGPTRAALINLAEALYADLQARGIGVSLVNPGCAGTPPAVPVTPEQAAQEILRGWARGAFEIDVPRRVTRWIKLRRLLPYGAYFAAVRRAAGR
ncbi:SDR family NAD(P)-dependent oxidoreductase [Variovorax terrae]|uniref:SDR family NAD(P)-dependent oxidoreductase n=1 Tax=Variovorax terrae TaxID=2923278 RepID=A0A9X2ARN9_9BURK|nr:SDR family NAD(P)-dependent oxidoreductase [Variovorax terrae]MCJ0765817.1 SDR family NAD(P)-dependent oxidoreductase [Variovorax terrae]